MVATTLPRSLLPSTYYCIQYQLMCLQQHLLAIRLPFYFIHHAANLHSNCMPLHHSTVHLKAKIKTVWVEKGQSKVMLSNAILWMLLFLHRKPFLWVILVIPDVTKFDVKNAEKNERLRIRSCRDKCFIIKYILAFWIHLVAFRGSKNEIDGAKRTFSLIFSLVFHFSMNI